MDIAVKIQNLNTIDYLMFFNMFDNTAQIENWVFTV